jgi:hypothetical protein
MLCWAAALLLLQGRRLQADAERRCANTYRYYDGAAASVPRAIRIRSEGLTPREGRGVWLQNQELVMGRAPCCICAGSGAWLYVTVGLLVLCGALPSFPFPHLCLRISPAASVEYWP